MISEELENMILRGSERRVSNCGSSYEKIMTDELLENLFFYVRNVINISDADFCICNTYEKRIRYCKINGEKTVVVFDKGLSEVASVANHLMYLPNSKNEIKHYLYQLLLESCRRKNRDAYQRLEKVVEKAMLPSSLLVRENELVPQLANAREFTWALLQHIFFLAHEGFHCYFNENRQEALSSLKIISQAIDNLEKYAGKGELELAKIEGTDYQVELYCDSMGTILALDFGVERLHLDILESAKAIQMAMGTLLTLKLIKCFTDKMFRDDTGLIPMIVHNSMTRYHFLYVSVTNYYHERHPESIPDIFHILGADKKNWNSKFLSTMNECVKELGLAAKALSEREETK